MQLNSILSSLLQLITEQDPRVSMPLLLIYSPLSIGSSRLHYINTEQRFCFWQIQCNRLHFG
jgi:hypothetical protein